jgi:ubiquinone/menaquinone biosynthesis C-methylase UbiE
MADIYATIASADPATQERLAGILELRAADPQQRAMLESYLSEITLPGAARVLEIGCGTGAVTRALARRPGVAEAVGVDPSPVFVARARELGAALGNVTFEVADGRALRLPDRDFDAVVFHTTLCHVPQPELALKEAFRVLRPGGTLALFDGDYATITVALGEHDPLQDRFLGADRARALRIVESRGSPARRGRRVLRLHRVCELHRPEAGLRPPPVAGGP